MLLKQSSLHVQVTKTCLNLCSMKELGLLPLIRDGILPVLWRSHSSNLLGFSSSSQVPLTLRSQEGTVRIQFMPKMLQPCLKHGTLNAHSSANHYVSVVSPTFYVSNQIQILWSQVSNHNYKKGRGGEGGQGPSYGKVILHNKRNFMLLNFNKKHTPDTSLCMKKVMHREAMSW